MKKHIFYFLFLCLLPILGVAQNITVTVSGIVTNASTGNPIANQLMYIMTDSIPTTFGTIFMYNDTAITNSNGEYTESFMLPPGVSQGIAYVYTINCNGAQVMQVLPFPNSTGGWNLTADFQLCTNTTGGGCQAAFSSIVSGSALNNLALDGSASQPSNPSSPLTYTWSVMGGGMNYTSTVANPTFLNLPTGSYTICLTIADNAGCSDAVCDSVYVGSTSGNCQASFTFSVSGTSVSFDGQALNASTPINYFWNITGSNGTPVATSTQEDPTFTLNANGTYNACLTISDSISVCNDTYCGTFTIGGSALPTSINFYVLLDSLSNPNGGDTLLTYLIQYDSAAATLTAVDSLYSIAANGGVMSSFNNLTPGTQYLLKSSIYSGINYATSMPTYYGQSLIWSNAVYVQPSFNSYTIVLISGVNPGGPGFIGGLVSQGANRMLTGELENVSVLLFDMNDNPIAYAYSDANGEFGFSNLAYGTYKVYPDVLNKPTTPVIVTISATTPSVSTVSISVNSTDVNGSVTAIDAQQATYFGQSSQAYPNPASESLTIETTLKQATTLTFSLNNMMGQTVWMQQEKLGVGNHMQNISLAELPIGIYFAKITAENGEGEIIKIIKE